MTPNEIQDSKEPIDKEAWAKEFDVTAMQIDDAIAAVGSGKADVEMYLKGSHSTTNSDVTQESR